MIIFYISFFIIFLCSHLFLRNTYLIKIDPFIYIIFHSSLVVASVIHEYTSIFWGDIFIVLLSHIFFISGMRVSHRIFIKKSTTIFKTHSFFKLKNNNSNNYLISIYCVLYIILAMYVGITLGFLLFSEDPEAYKLQFLSGGMGIIWRITVALSLPMIFFVLVYWSRSNKIERLISVIAMVTCIISSGKSILLTIFICYLLSVLYKTIIFGETIRQSYFKYVFMVLFAFAFAIYTLNLAYGEAGFEIVLELFLERITTAAGLGLTTYLNNHTYFDQKLPNDVFTFFWNYLVVPFAGPLRLVDYVPTLGREIGIYITGGENYGPNPSVFLEGIFYFGNFFCFIYVFIIGIFITFIRYSGLIFARKFGPHIGALGFVYFYNAALSLSTDFLVFFALISSYVAFLFFAYCLSKIRFIIYFSIKSAAT